MQYQTTLRDGIAIEGVGLHTGLPARMRIFPAPAGSGLRFRLDDAVEFPARADYVVDTARATVLGCGEHRVSTGSADLKVIEVHLVGGDKLRLGVGRVG